LRFTVLPAIDLMGGKAVSLEKGDPKAVKYAGDPLQAAEEFKQAGWMHIIDLDAAFSAGTNIGTIKKILGSGCNAEVGGGIRSVEKAGELLDAGAKRIVIGTKAFDPEFMETLKKEAGKRKIVVAIDSLNEKIVVKGWKERTKKGLYEAAGELERYAGHYLFTPVEIEGMLAGPELWQLKKLCETTKVPIIYSGGIASLQDVRDIKKAGAEGCIIGRALHEKKFTLEDALKIEAVPGKMHESSGNSR